MCRTATGRQGLSAAYLSSLAGQGGHDWRLPTLPAEEEDDMADGGYLTHYNRRIRPKPNHTKAGFLNRAVLANNLGMRFTRPYQDGSPLRPNMDLILHAARQTLVPPAYCGVPNKQPAALLRGATQNVIGGNWHTKWLMAKKAPRLLTIWPHAQAHQGVFAEEKRREEIRKEKERGKKKVK